MMNLTARFWIWCAAVAVLGAVFVLDVIPHFQLETNILALLPPRDSDPATERALVRFTDLLGRNVVYLIGQPDFAAAKKSATRFADRLRASPAFETVRLEVDSSVLQQGADAYMPYRDSLLSARTRDWLREGDDAAVLSAAQQALYSPAAFLRRSGAGSDPLDLFGDFLAQATPPTGNIGLREGVLNLSGGTPPLQYVMVSALLSGMAFSTAEQDLVAPVLKAAEADARAEGATVNGSSLIQHAIAAAGLARHEIDLFGGVQFIGLILVLWWVFRSGRVLLLSAATLATGVIAALTVSHYAFAKLHVLTLVFCSNLAGIAIDYSIYFCADQFRAPGDWRASDAAKHIGPAITMSAAAAVLSYALLAVAPFPGLRQAALFCCIGLIGAYGCVMGWFPRWVKPSPRRPAERLTALFTRLMDVRVAAQRRTRGWLWPLVALATAAGLWQLHFTDDVRVLQPDTPLLVQQEQQVRELIGNLPDSRFFLLRAADSEALLQAEEQLRQKLDPLVSHHAVDGYSAVTRALPSAARQAEDHQLLATQVFDAGGLAERFMQQLGFDAAAIAQRRLQFAQDPQVLTPEVWLASPASEPYRHQWLGDIGVSSFGPHTWASVVTLLEVHDIPAVAHAADGIPQAHFVDRIDEISDVLRRYRERALALVAAASVASALLLALAYGLRRGALLMVTPVAACLATLAVLGASGVQVTFFNVVALHLVMGLSMEYAILLLLPELRSPAILLSATLAAGLALLAFGLLALSRTPFIHSLGITVAIGVLFGFAFAVCAGTLKNNKGKT